MKHELTRRDFLRVGTTAALASSIAVGSAGGESAETPSQRYEAEVPDTLDLAERGAFASNALTGAADPGHGYETYQGGHLDQRPPYLCHRYGGPCLQKPVHALPMMRVMSGSTLNHDYDNKMMDAIIRDIDDNGLWWLKTEGRPWRAETYGKDFVSISSSGRLMVALADWYRYDHNAKWLEITERMAHGLSKIAIRDGDRAMYYHCFLRSGWDPKNSPLPNTNRAIYINGLVLRGLVAWYAVSGDQQALNLAEKLARHMQTVLIGSWPKEGPSMVSAAEHALWEGHFHAQAMGMIGLAEYANAANDVRLKKLVADFYEWGRNFGMARMGFFPAVIGPAEKIREESKAIGEPDEGCAVADMILLAALLTDGGVGDYWDDVDQYVRNHLVEHQILRRDLVEEIVAAGPEHKLDRRMETDDHVIDRQLGAFISISDPTVLYGWWTMCCLGNCSVALYKAWESIVRFEDGIAQVNLLLNRASPWVDVNSYLPYEGKAVLQNKAAHVAYVRVPAWVDKKAVRCRVNHREFPLHWLNNYLIVGGLAAKDIVIMDFPMPDMMETHTEAAYGQQYTCRFRGNTLVDISPRAARPVRTHDISDDRSVFAINKGYPLYLRESYKRDRAPMKRVHRYVSPTVI